MNIHEIYRKIEISYNDCYDSPWVYFNSVLQNIYDDLNKKYFNNKLSIKVEDDFINIDGIEYSVMDSLYYLERIHELQQIKMKIDNINRNVLT